MWPNSPAPTDAVKEELESFRRVLRKSHIRSRLVYTRSGNMFTLKRWVVVNGRDFSKAIPIAQDWIARTKTTYVHDADLESVPPAMVA